MSLPTQMGRYIAAPMGWSVEESDRGSKLLQFICRFDLRYWWDGAAWVDVASEAMGITGYFYLMKSNGQPNTNTIDNLKAAMGWDGRTLASLNNGDWSGIEVQITVAHEMFEGKPQTKVKWIAPRDEVPGGSIKPADPQQVQALDGKYGSMLRALAGAAVPARSASPATSPRTSGGGTALMEPPPSNGAATATPKVQAWNAFLAKWKPHAQDNPVDAPLRDERWKTAIAETFGKGTDPRALVDEQWSVFATTIEKDYDAATGSFVPF